MVEIALQLTEINVQLFLKIVFDLLSNYHQVEGFSHS
jgi:hypothetical protein